MKHLLVLSLLIPVILSGGCAGGGSGDGTAPILYFTMNDGDSGGELGITDGSSAGTYLVVEFQDSSA